MMLWLVPLLPIALGLGLWAAGARREPDRRVLGAAAVGTLLGILGMAVWAALTSARAQLSWGAGLELSLAVTPLVGVAAVLVPLVAAPVLAWAAAHENPSGLPRLLGLLVCFAGAMELLVMAADLLTLALGWELVGGLSWGLIGHRSGDREATRSANYAFNATRIGGLGLLVAAGAALAAAGSFSFGALPQVAASPWGNLLAAGLLVAAASKSAQLPFAPWLFRAMQGPSSVSALLHSSTMVAAGAWVLVRLHEPLGMVGWFGPTAIAIGLTTAIAGGVVAASQGHAKKLLAASTSAHYGLMFAAVGAGFAGAALVHLVTHAAFKALLFLAAGVALGAAGSARLQKMRLGKRMPQIAAASAIGALALAAVPPLGGAWSKEQVVAATGHAGTAVGWVAIAAGALSAWYATRFQLLAFGRTQRKQKVKHAPTATERVALWFLAALCVLLGGLWLPAAKPLLEGIAPLANSKPVELVASLVAVALAIAASYRAHQRATPENARLADWLGVPQLIHALAIAPTVAVAQACARFDDRVVDAGVRGAARIGAAISRLLTRLVELDIDRAVHGLARATLGFAGFSRRTDDDAVDASVHGIARGVGAAGENARRAQGGAVPTYYSLLAAGLFALVLILALWR